MNRLELDYLQTAQELFRMLKCQPQHCKIEFAVEIIDGKTQINQPTIYFDTDYGLSTKDVGQIRDMGLEILEASKVTWPNIKVRLGYIKT